MVLLSGLSLVFSHHCLKSCLQMGHEPTETFLSKNILQLLFTFYVEKMKAIKLY